MNNFLVVFGPEKYLAILLEGGAGDRTGYPDQHHRLRDGNLTCGTELRNVGFLIRIRNSVTQERLP